MLELHQIKKDYVVAGETVSALKGISVSFRDSEFVSILGPSGCGKTTLLNIIGGLDKYTSGDLVIEGTSTKEFGDRDWDTYRNHSIGFIFQSYHLIPHQTILQNVELALTIAGVDKKERRARAIDALDKVGLKDKINNRPNQLSGGQAQRVAIARALINDPEIVLADEPTGALDSVTSVQIMELLKSISRDRLVVMVTHNPELAEQYSTRIVRLKDGEIIGDTRPFRTGNTPENTQLPPVYAPAKKKANLSDGPDDIFGSDFVFEGFDKTALPSGETAAASEPPAEEHADASDDGVRSVKKVDKGKKKSAMSIGMAMSLSLKNLLSKGKRTAMVSVAGSIGIIGVSLVLAISSGVQGYITSMENDMLSGNPVSITQSTYDFTTLMALNGDKVSKEQLDKLMAGEKIGVTSLLKTLGTFSTGFEKSNQFTDEYLSYIDDMPAEYVNVVQYQYAFNIVNNLYTDFTVSDALSEHFADNEDMSKYVNEYDMSVAAIRSMYASVLSKVEQYSSWGSMISSVETFKEVPNNFDYVMSQYDVVAIEGEDADGKSVPVKSGYSEEELKALFNDKSTLIMVLDDYCMQDLTLAQYGYFTQDEFLDYAFKGVGDDEDITLVGDEGLAYSRFIGEGAKKFTYYPNDCVYTKVEYKAKPQMTDAQIRMMLQLMPGDASQTAQLAEGIIAARIQDQQAGTDTNLKNVLRAMISAGNPTAAPEEIAAQVEQYYEMFKLPAKDAVTTGYVANAYSNAYTIEDGDEDINLAAFEEKDAYENRVEMGVKLILQKKSDVSYGCLTTGFYYTNALTEYILGLEKDSEIVGYLSDEANPSMEKVPMYVDYYYVDPEKDKEGETTTAGKKFYILNTEEGSIETNTNLMSSLIDSVISGMGTAQQSSLTVDIFGGSRTPIAVYIYPVDFETKDNVTAYLDAWNNACVGSGTVTLSDGTIIDGLEEADKITYTDTVGLMIDMVNTMIQMITIALIAFTALSLVVSTVMIGIITYVSVVERVKEIGILRAVGARKKDIKRLFNSETFIIGLVAGLFGILVTYLLSLVVNVIVYSLAGFWGIAALPWWQALIMVALSIVLTLISGLIPASAAAKKDPVVALRTE